MGFAVGALVLVSIAAVIYASLSQRAVRQAEHDLRQVATRDRLTGLPNRATLEPQLAAMLDQASSASARIAVLVIGLNRFESVNQTYGHEVGDALMVAAARQLAKARQPGEVLVRHGGPQFVVLCPEVRDTAAVESRAAEFQAAVQVPYEISSDHLRITAGVGVVVTDQRVTNAHDLVVDATLALNQADDDGPGRISVFDLSMRHRLSSIATEQRLQDALERGEFLLHYLPVVALENLEIVGVEALLRWADPDRGVVSPSAFLRVLDDSGLIVPVGNWAIVEACRQTRTWSDQFPGSELLTTVNVSHRQLAQPDFLEHVLGAISDAGIEPTQLCLEITEGSLMRDVDASWAMLRQAKEQGIKLALDDFGVGFSSLNYLRRFQLDVLKIDRVFVQGLGASREDEAIVQQMVGLAHALDIVPVAEGVDAADQADALRSVRCDFAQGYWFSPPQPPDTIARMLERGRITPGGARQGIDWSGGPPSLSPEPG